MWASHLAKSDQSKTSVWPVSSTPTSCPSILPRPWTSVDPVMSTNLGLIGTVHGGGLSKMIDLTKRRSYNYSP